MQQLISYFFTLSPEKKLFLTCWELEGEPSQPRFLYNGGDHGLLYRSEQTEPLIVDYVPQRFLTFLNQAKEIVITELNQKTEEIVRRYHVSVTKVPSMPPMHLSYTKQDFITWALQSTILIQQKSYFSYPLRDGGLLFMIEAQEEDPQNPTLFFEGKKHAFLWHSSKKTLVLDYLEPSIIPLLSRLDKVWICECDFTSKKLIREYMVQLRSSNRLPEIKLDISPEDLSTALITPTHQQKIYYFLKTETELHLFLLRHNTTPENTFILYDGGNHALLYRNENEGIILGYIPEEIKILLKELKTITVHGCDFETGTETFIYPASVRLIAKLPQLTWDVNLSFM